MLCCDAAVYVESGGRKEAMSVEGHIVMSGVVQPVDTPEVSCWHSFVCILCTW